MQSNELSYVVAGIIYVFREIEAQITSECVLRMSAQRCWYISNTRQHPSGAGDRDNLLVSQLYFHNVVSECDALFRNNVELHT